MPQTAVGTGLPKLKCCQSVKWQSFESHRFKQPAQPVPASLSRLGSETSANRDPDHATDDGSGGEFGKPMDRHRDGEPNVKRVNQSAEDNYASSAESVGKFIWFWELS